MNQDHDGFNVQDNNETTNEQSINNQIIDERGKINSQQHTVNQNIDLQSINNDFQNQNTMLSNKPDSMLEHLTIKESTSDPITIKENVDINNGTFDNKQQKKKN